MRSRQRRRRRSGVSFLFGRIASEAAGLIADPFRTGVTGVLGLVLLWIVLTKSLPYALATAQPDVALALNPDNPSALIAKSEALKKSLVALESAGVEKAKASEDKASGERPDTFLPSSRSEKRGRGA